MASDHVLEIVPEEALLSIVEKCLLTPQALAKQLIDNTDAEQIFYAYPNDRREQLYQILYKWKQENPKGTWQELSFACDSGVGHAMRTLSCEYQSSGGDHTIVFDEHRDEGGRREEEERGVTIEEGGRREEEEGVQPSAPPYPFTDVYTGCRGDGDISDRLLTTDDLPDVIEAIYYENNWYDLGLALRIPDPILEEIQLTYMRQINECRKECMRRWLKQTGKIRPSWRTLCQALRNPIVGNDGLANRIAQSHRIM